MRYMIMVKLINHNVSVSLQQTTASVNKHLIQLHMDMYKKLHVSDRESTAHQSSPQIAYD
jgi:hypothetical protein